MKLQDSQGLSANTVKGDVIKYKGIMAILKAKENVTWTFCADKPEVTDDRGLKMKANEVLKDLGGFDLVFLPRGMPTRKNSV
jgi:hypothetical protein